MFKILCFSAIFICAVVGLFYLPGITSYIHKNTFMFFVEVIIIGMFGAISTIFLYYFRKKDKFSFSKTLGPMMIVSFVFIIVHIFFELTGFYSYVFDTTDYSK